MFIYFSGGGSTTNQSRLVTKTPHSSTRHCAGLRGFQVRDAMQKAAEMKKKRKEKQMAQSAQPQGKHVVEILVKRSSM